MPASALFAEEVATVKELLHSSSQDPVCSHIHSQGRTSFMWVRVCIHHSSYNPIPFYFPSFKLRKPTKCRYWFVDLIFCMPHFQETSPKSIGIIRHVFDPITLNSKASILFISKPQQLFFRVYKHPFICNLIYKQSFGRLNRRQVLRRRHRRLLARHFPTSIFFGQSIDTRW